MTSTATNLFTLEPSTFHFKASHLEKCDIVVSAFKRYHELIFIDPQYKKSPHHSVLDHVQVEISANSNDCGYPDHNQDESYSIEVPVKGKNFGLIKANNVWGALRGLETFSQLVYPADGSKHLQLNGTVIHDVPRYKYRGMLLDTARHYIPVVTILANLDAMAYNKLNVFHWHLVDDQSFPFISKTFPKIHEKGAYTPKHVYHPEDVQTVIEYARYRGIRVIPEIDTPGHTHAMARAYPELLTPCYGDGHKANTPHYPLYSQSEILNPLKNETFDFIKKLFGEFKATFKDKFVHLGMDEVFYACWKSNPDIAAFMHKHGMKEYHQVEEYYVQQTIKNVKDVGYKYMMWQDPVDNGIKVSLDKCLF